MKHSEIILGNMVIHCSKSAIGTYKIHLVKCLITGRFLKHSLAMKALCNASTEYTDTLMTLAWCILSNIIGMIAIAI